MKRFLLILMVIIGILSVGIASAAQKKVLVIHSYHTGLPWVEQCNHGITSTLSGISELKYIYLDTKRIPGSKFQEKADAAMAVFRKFKPEVVMLGDDNALKLLGSRIAESGTPIVFFGINNNPRKYFGTIPDNVTGVLERVPLFPWIRLLKEIIPSAEKALVLMDDSPTAQAIIDVTFGDRKNVFLEGVSVGYSVASDWAQWRQIVLKTDSYDFITIPVFHALKGAAGEHTPALEVIRWTSAHSPVPVFAYQDYAVSDDGAAGSYVIYGEAHGRLAAQMVRTVLETGPSHMPPMEMDQKGKFYFNKKQLKRFDLKLPKTIRRESIFRE